VRIAYLSGLVLLAGACAPQADTAAAATVPQAPAALSAAALDSVKAVDAAFAAGINAKDSAAVMAVYADDAHVLPPDSPAMDKAAAGAVIAGMIAGGASEMKLNSTTVYGIGDLAYMVGTASFKMGAASETVKYTEVLRRGTDGKWRYVVDMFSGIAPSPAPEKK
jgi:ketosteroid isomerase-like protein